MTLRERGPVDVLQGISLDGLIESLRRSGALPPGSGREQEGQPQIVLFAPAWDLIDETLIEGGAGASAAAVSTEYGADHMVDVRHAERILFLCRSTFNQIVTVQVVGAPTDNPTALGALVAVGAPESLPATTGRIGLAVNPRSAPYPFLGVTVTTGAAAPTAGRISVRAYGLRWRIPQLPDF